MQKLAYHQVPVMYRGLLPHKKISDFQTRNETLLVLLLIDQENLLCCTLVSDSFGCCEHSIIELGVPLNPLKILEEQISASSVLTWGNFVRRYHGR